MKNIEYKLLTLIFIILLWIIALKKIVKLEPDYGVWTWVAFMFTMLALALIL